MLSVQNSSMISRFFCGNITRDDVPGFCKQLPSKRNMPILKITVLRNLRYLELVVLTTFSCRVYTRFNMEFASDFSNISKFLVRTNFVIRL